ncbi:MAG TPA: hypothetical protein VKB86_20880 [Pyrinomonadaceae bacterium]|nr:hypothetical protein [Pyrinomonadaceae bacterium]
MKQCPACNRTYTDDDLLFCLEDGTQLQTVGRSSDAPTTFDSDYDPNKTLAFSPARDTNPPPANVYSPMPVNQPSAQQSWNPPPTPQYMPTPQAQAAGKSGGKGWIVVAIAAVLVLGIGIVVLLAIIGKQSPSKNTGSNAIANRATTTNSSNSDGTNRSTTTTLPTHFKDDFSTQNWPTGDNAYGSFYQDGEYHMKGKPSLYVYMFPYNTTNYASKDADVKVTARSVDGTSPGYGYGLIMNGKNNRNNKLDGYGFLIYTSSTPKYEIARFDNGDGTILVNWTDAPMLRTGTTPNQLEVRAQGSQLSFYINGQFVKSITDTANITDGFVGLYTSETNEVAFDDMEISR